MRPCEGAGVVVVVVVGAELVVFVIAVVVEFVTFGEASDVPRLRRTIASRGTKKRIADDDDIGFFLSFPFPFCRFLGFFYVCESEIDFFSMRTNIKSDNSVSD